MATTIDDTEEYLKKLQLQVTELENEAYAKDIEILKLLGKNTDLKEFKRELTYIMIKPDGVMRNLVGEVLERFENKGFKVVGLKLIQPTKSLLEEHYKDLSSKPFFGGLIKYMQMGPVCCIVFEGDGVVKTGRKMLGETNPKDSLPGSLRGDFSIDIGRNIIHGSDSVEAAQHEISLWFPEGLNQYKHMAEKFVYEKELDN